VTEPRRVLIDWEYLCDGIEWIPTKEEFETPYPQGLHLAEVQRPGGPPVIRSWRERLSEQLLRDLKAWNDSWGSGNPAVTGNTVRVLQERGRELATRVQNELGTGGWEALYNLGGRVYRVHPPGSWPVETWMQDLLGYAPRGRKRQEKKKPRASQDPGGKQAPASPHPHRSGTR
jgi:hypothetical protein